MGVCPRCGAEGGQVGGPCPVCGAAIESRFKLELAEPAAGSRAPRSMPSSRLGGAGAAAGPAAASPVLPVRRGRAPAPAFAEIDAPRRRLFWRVTRVPLIVILAWFTLSHLALGAKWVFIDNVNLVLHEAGHHIFSWGGPTLAVLGGTLGQLMWPAAFAAYFWIRQRNRFATVVCIWWFGENLIGVGRYMADAAFEELPLVGGDIHDWHFLFGRWGLLSSGQEIGSATRWIGALVMLVSLALLARWTASPSIADLRRDADLS